MSSTDKFLQISYASSSAVLSDRRVYRNYYRTIPSDELLPPLLTATMKYYEWKQLAIVTETIPQYLKVRLSRCKRIFVSLIKLCQGRLWSIWEKNWRLRIYHWKQQWSLHQMLTNLGSKLKGCWYRHATRLYKVCGLNFVSILRT